MHWSIVKYINRNTEVMCEVIGYVPTNNPYPDVRVLQEDGKTLVIEPDDLIDPAKDTRATNIAEYVMKLENALLSINRIYMNVGIRKIIKDALSGRDSYLDISDMEIPTEFVGTTEEKSID